MNSEKLRNKNKWAAMGMWIAYVWATTLAGLAIHPYRSVRRIVLTDRVLLPVTISPLIGLVMLLAVGRAGSYALELGHRGRELAALVLGSTLFGMLLWQGLILVLIFRFWRARLR